MEFTVSNQSNHTQIVLSGRFTFHCNQKFKQIMELLENSELQMLTLNLKKVDFIDSAGLGMLLLLRDQCHKQNITISIDAMHGQVEKVFVISKFDQLFSINP